MEELGDAVWTRFNRGKKEQSKPGTIVGGEELGAWGQFKLLRELRMEVESVPSNMTPNCSFDILFMQIHDPPDAEHTSRDGGLDELLAILQAVHTASL